MVGEGEVLAAIDTTGSRCTCHVHTQQVWYELFTLHTKSWYNNTSL